MDEKGEAIKGVLMTYLPHVAGAIVAPLFEKITSWLGIFQKKPRPLNDTMQEIQQANDAAARGQRFVGVHVVCFSDSPTSTD